MAELKTKISTPLAIAIVVNNYVYASTAILDKTSSGQYRPINNLYLLNN